MKWIGILLLAISLKVSAETSEPVSPVSTTVVQESEIPVNLEVGKKPLAGESPFFKIMMTLGIVGVLGCASYFLIRRYAKPGNSQSQANQIKILSQHYLGPKKSLAVVRVSGESMLIGITEQNISLLKGLSLLDDEIPEKTPQSFAPIFNQANQARTAQEKAEQDGSGRVSSAKDEDGLDEFSISGIKDFVSTKLKNMRTLE